MLSFFGDHFGGTELEPLRRPDRTMIAIGRGDHVNGREMDRAAEYSGTDTSTRAA